MSWEPITGTANYTSGFTDATVTAEVTAGTHAVDPFLNDSGTQDYTTYYEGSNGVAIVPDPGNSGLSAPTAGGYAGN